MSEARTITCAFCKGTGENPHFRGTCPVCKGRGKNQVTGKYMACDDCRGSGQKGGTTLTCYSCAGLGVIPDRRAIVEKAKAEFKKGLMEMEEERKELKRKPPSVHRFKQAKQYDDDNPEKELQIRLEGKSRYCQSCAREVSKDTLVKICLKCFRKLKKEGL